MCAIMFSSTVCFSKRKGSIVYIPTRNIMLFFYGLELNVELNAPALHLVIFSRCTLIIQREMSVRRKQTIPRPACFSVTDTTSSLITDNMFEICSFSTIIFSKFAYFRNSYKEYLCFSFLFLKSLPYLNKSLDIFCSASPHNDININVYDNGLFLFIFDSLM